MSNAKQSTMIYPILRPSPCLPVAALVTPRAPVERQRGHGKAMHCCRPCKSTRALLGVVVAWPARVKEDASSVMPAEHSPGQRAFDIEHVPLLFSVDEATAREDVIEATVQHNIVYPAL